SLVQYERLDNHRAEARHALREPGRDAATVERKIGAAGAGSHTAVQYAREERDEATGSTDSVACRAVRSSGQAAKAPQPDAPAPSTSTVLKCTRGQIFSERPPLTSLAFRSKAARNGLEGSSACSRRSSTRRSRSSSNRSSTERKPVPVSTNIALTFAVAIQTDS